MYKEIVSIKYALQNIFPITLYFIYINGVYTYIFIEPFSFFWLTSNKYIERVELRTQHTQQ